MEKSPEAFRTIREVAEGMDLPQHVLRFWETRFPQIRPLKRAGGRRYYRPDDVERLRLIKRLLYEEGYTIRGVQKLFRQQGAQALVHGMLDQRPSAPPKNGANSGVQETASFDPDIGAAEEEIERFAAAPFVPEAAQAPLAPRGPLLGQQDIEALRAMLADLRATLTDLREAQRVLAKARSQES